MHSNYLEFLLTLLFGKDYFSLIDNRRNLILILIYFMTFINQIISVLS